MPRLRVSKLRRQSEKLFTDYWTHEVKRVTSVDNTFCYTVHIISAIEKLFPPISFPDEICLPKLLVSQLTPVIFSVIYVSVYS